MRKERGKMKSNHTQNKSKLSIRSLWGISILITVFMANASLTYAGKVASSCRKVALNTYIAELIESQSDYNFEVAKANTYPDSDERKELVSEARADLKETRAELWERYKARVEVCAGTMEDYYNPEIDPEDFLSPEEIAANPNPFLPLIPGTVYTYEADTEDGLETIRVEVTEDTKEILGIDCIVVRDTVSIEDELVEDTKDWFTQDRDGNVWYFGEISFNYEDGEIEDLEGSWEADVEGAKPGIVMFANPEAMIGTVYRQEYAVGEAEDIGEIVGVDATAETTYMVFEGCLQTADYTPMEPGVIEHKFYAPGIGFVREQKVGEDEIVELVSIETP